MKEDPSIEVTVDDLEGGDEFENLKGEGRRAWDRVWSEVKASRAVTERRFATLFLIPGGVWLVLLFGIPLGIVFAISFGTTDDLGNALYGWYPENYSRAFDPIFLPVLLRSVLYAVATVVLCLASATRSRTTSPASGGRGRTC